jgi:hypothetical protein
VKQLISVVSGVILMNNTLTERMADLEKRGEEQGIDADENERLRSLVIFISGLPESTAVKSSERIKQDRQAVTELLDELQVEATPVTVYRLSSRDPTKRPRLLKLVLSTSRQQWAVLKASKNLRGSTNFNETYIRPSLTKEQRKLDFKLRQAVKKLRGQGMQKVHIKNWKLMVSNIEYDIYFGSPCKEFSVQGKQFNTHYARVCGAKFTE